MEQDATQCVRAPSGAIELGPHAFSIAPDGARGVFSVALPTGFDLLPLGQQACARGYSQSPQRGSSGNTARASAVRNAG